jgi:hypothetical protein
MATTKPDEEQHMDDEQGGPRGAAAWQEQRAAIAKRNSETQKRGQAERRSRDRAADARERVNAVREAKELDALNAQIARGKKLD